MNDSFKDFATQFAGLPLPTNVIAVAKSLNFSPNSLRALINQGAPYVPDTSTFNLVDNSNNPGVVAFFWADDAILPLEAPWITANWTWTPNAKRAATSWQFQLWEAAGGAQIANATVSPDVLQLPGAGGRVQYDYVGELDDNYLLEIIAYNNYGSASSGQIPVTITLANLSPSITVIALGGNTFEVKGSGFTPNNSVQITVSVTVDNKSLPNIPLISADPQGNFKEPIPCQSLCSMAGGAAQLQFQATDQATNTPSGTKIANCSG